MDQPLYIPAVVTDRQLGDNTAAQVKYQAQGKAFDSSSIIQTDFMQPLRPLPDTFEIGTPLAVGDEVLIVIRGSVWQMVLITQEKYAIQECT